MKKSLCWMILLLSCFFLQGNENGNKSSWSYLAGKNVLTVVLEIPKAMYYYREGTWAKVGTLDGGKELQLKEEPLFRVRKDSISGEKVQVYPGPGRIRWVFTVPEKNYPLWIKLAWQSCSDGSDGKEAVCFMPGEKQGIVNLVKGKAVFVRSGEGESISGKGQTTDSDEKDDDPALGDYTLIRSDSGYLPPKEFLAFLKGEKKESFFDLGGKSFLFMLILVFLGGIALNLTPCVLPMIPINLAMIGGRDSSRKSSIFHGLTYGCGMALAYGITGAVVVLTQSTFGALDSTWYFNAATCVIFFLLGLSMFDVFTLDLSKYKGGTFYKLNSARYAGVFFMGALTALLAGACVAPVVVAVLIQSGKMYNSGEMCGLFLPFVLGIGMALPWPLAAAGLSVLPKPGNWMKYVKYILGILIFSLGFYYGALAWEIGMRSKYFSGAEKAQTSYNHLQKALKDSSRTGKEIFIDFTAQWCKNCKAMEKNVFPDPAIRKELSKMIVVKVDATDLKDPLIESILKKFEVKGLPSYRIIKGK